MGRPFSCSTNPLATARFAAVLHRFGQPTPLTGSHRPPLFPSRSSFSRTTPKRDGDTLDLFRCRRHFGAYFGEHNLSTFLPFASLSRFWVGFTKDDTHQPKTALVLEDCSCGGMAALVVDGGLMVMRIEGNGGAC
ncbi:hypothetical protein V6N11_073429 [Hibiscus sabdariffa]|uniref:Uncharacterized protein n=1 Tax=Hibiscus sabdariffa TaxID=183260 RepID=A0ABR2N9D9_9ROSI